LEFQEGSVSRSDRAAGSRHQDVLRGAEGSDIIIGRKHADAPYDDGKDIWDGLEAQRKFDKLPGKLEIKPVKVGFAAFFEELGRVGLVDEYGPKGFKQVAISGRDLRKKLQSGELPDPRIMRRETAEVLIAAMAGK
jgi:sulfate adenylyltransferase